MWYWLSDVLILCPTSLIFIMSLQGGLTNRKSHTKPVKGRPITRRGPSVIEVSDGELSGSIDLSSDDGEKELPRRRAQLHTKSSSKPPPSHKGPRVKKGAKGTTGTPKKGSIQLSEDDWSSGVEIELSGDDSPRPSPAPSKVASSSLQTAAAVPDPHWEVPRAPAASGRPKSASLEGAHQDALRMSRPGSAASRPASAASRPGSAASRPGSAGSRPKSAGRGAHSSRRATPQPASGFSNRPRSAPGLPQGPSEVRTSGHVKSRLGRPASPEPSPRGGLSSAIPQQGPPSHPSEHHGVAGGHEGVRRPPDAISRPLSRLSWAASSEPDSDILSDIISEASRSTFGQSPLSSNPARAGGLSSAAPSPARGAWGSTTGGPLEGAPGGQRLESAPGAGLRRDTEERRLAEEASAVSAVEDLHALLGGAVFLGGSPASSVASDWEGAGSRAGSRGGAAAASTAPPSEDIRTEGSPARAHAGPSAAVGDAKADLSLRLAAAAAEAATDALFARLSPVGFSPAEAESAESSPRSAAGSRSPFRQAAPDSPRPAPVPASAAPAPAGGGTPRATRVRDAAVQAGGGVAAATQVNFDEGFGVLHDLGCGTVPANPPGASLGGVAAPLGANLLGLLASLHASLVGPRGSASFGAAAPQVVPPGGFPGSWRQPAGSSPAPPSAPGASAEPLSAAAPRRAGGASWHGAAARDDSEWSDGEGRSEDGEILDETEAGWGRERVQSRRGSHGASPGVSPRGEALGGASERGPSVAWSRDGSPRPEESPRSEVSPSPPSPPAAGAAGGRAGDWEWADGTRPASGLFEALTGLPKETLPLLVEELNQDNVLR